MVGDGREQMAKTTVPSSEFTDPELAALGLKCGLEIHQQLDVGKLFCRCPSSIREDAPDFTVVRSLRASAGETGEVDAAAQHEQQKRKRFRYHGYHDSTCLVELDEEPPAPLNPAALEATLQVTKLIDAELLEEVHVMRKTVVDGSNTSGFQRTALVAMGGALLEEPVRIQAICLEEDSAKIIERTSSEDRYNLSRLGIPLIELATEPDIRTPMQAQRVAAEIGMLLRSTGKCKRGLGTIRQDLNVSITEGARVEIKGAQDLRLIPTLVENEMRRQRGLLNIRKELIERKMTSILLPAPQNLSAAFEKTACAFVGKGIKGGDSFVGICLPKMEGLLGIELFAGYRLGTELAGYAKTFGFGGIIHSDEKLEKYTFSETEIATAKRKLGVKKGDAFICLLGDHNKITDFFAFSLLPRLEQLLHGVPKEVRRANPDATTTFLRPMPGASRMYPETDIPRVRPDLKNIPLLKTLNEQEQELVVAYKLPPQHAKQLLRDGWDIHFFAREYPKLSPAFVATTLLDTPKELKRRHKHEIDFSLPANEQALHEILTAANKALIPREAVIELLAEVAAGKKLDFSRFAAVDVAEVEKAVKAVITADPDAPINALMGQVMARLRGKAEGKEVMELLKKHMKK